MGFAYQDLLHATAKAVLLCVTTVPMLMNPEMCAPSETLSKQVLELAPKPMISPSMGERRQFENWGRHLGGTDFRGLRRWGRSPH